MLQGSLVAIVTPMHEDGSIDWPALKRLVDWHCSQGTDALVVAGTTGESPTLRVEEHIELIKQVVHFAQGKIPVVAGTGANSTQEAIELTQAARAVGAHYGLSVVPYYNKPTQEGLYAHFKAIAEADPLPMILYNVPSRTVADLSNDTVLRLTHIPNIVGIKDATADLARAVDLFQRVPHGFACYTGDDATAGFFNLMGGHGVISVTANVAPKEMANMMRACFAGNVSEVRRINNQLAPLHQDLFIEANPIPVKWALQRMGRILSGIRLPLVGLSQQHQEAVLLALKKAGLIK